MTVKNKDNFADVAVDAVLMVRAEEYVSEAHKYLKKNVDIPIDEVNSIEMEYAGFLLHQASAIMKVVNDPSFKEERKKHD